MNFVLKVLIEQQEALFYKAKRYFTVGHLYSAVRAPLAPRDSDFKKSNLEVIHSSPAHCDRSYLSKTTFQQTTFYIEGRKVNLHHEVSRYSVDQIETSESELSPLNCNAKFLANQNFSQSVWTNLFPAPGCILRGLRCSRFDRNSSSTYNAVPAPLSSPRRSPACTWTLPLE